MKNIAFPLALIIFLTSCSIKTEPNEWQYKSSNAFYSYKKNFLSSNDNAAKNDLTRAIEHAKKGADINMLAKIYLAECALKISIGEEDRCEKYKNIADIAEDKSLDAYYALIIGTLTNEQLAMLPESYQKFALHVKNSDFKNANSEIVKMDKPTSIFLSSALIKENIEDTTVENIIDTASHNGYKKVVLFWLREKIKRTKDDNEREKLKKRVSVLESNN